MAPPSPNAQRYSPTMMWDSTVRAFTFPFHFFLGRGLEGGTVNPDVKKKKKN